MAGITATINGETWHGPAQTPLLEALEQLGFDPRLIALEYNGEILHRQHWPTKILQEGDRLEVVTIVGGGAILPSESPNTTKYKGHGQDRLG